MNLITRLSKTASSQISSKQIKNRVKVIQEFREKSKALRIRKQNMLNQIRRTHDDVEFDRWAPVSGKKELNDCKAFFDQELFKLQKQYGII